MIQNSSFLGATAGITDVSVMSTGRVMITGNSLYGGSLAYPGTTLAASNLP